MLLAKILRMTIPKSQGKQPYYDARKSEWGDMFPHPPKNRPQERFQAPKGKGEAEPEVQGADITLVSTGSEVCIAVDAAKELAEKHNIKARIVSIPCFEVFDAQSKEYRLSVLPDGIPSLSIEVMSTMGWERYTHEQFGLNRFGASGAYKDVYKASQRFISLLQNNC